MRYGYDCVLNQWEDPIDVGDGEGRSHVHVECIGVVDIKACNNSKKKNEICDKITSIRICNLRIIETIVAKETVTMKMGMEEKTDDVIVYDNVLVCSLYIGEAYGQILIYDICFEADICLRRRRDMYDTNINEYICDVRNYEGNNNIDRKN